jgi:hypothetical protein
MDRIEQSLKALEAFKDWTNYLLLTTVAAVGWTAGKDAACFSSPRIKTATVLCFAVSVVYAILTLALIPHVAEDIQQRSDKTVPSIYRVYWKGWWVDMRLTRLCFPQHILFLIGVLLYATGTTFATGRRSLLAFFAACFVILMMLLFSGKLPRR